MPSADVADDQLAHLISTLVRDVPDYPQPGVMFKDITPLLADGEAFSVVVDALAGEFGPVDKVAGIEARGFILAAPVALRLGAGFVPIRKKGKLPGITLAQDYQLEYGTATVEVHADAFAPAERVLVVDDVLATGGTARATADLVHRAGAQVAGIVVLLELSFLSGRSKLPDLPVSALLTVLSSFARSAFRSPPGRLRGPVFPRRQKPAPGVGLGEKHSPDRAAALWLAQGWESLVTMLRLLPPSKLRTWQM